MGLKNIAKLDFKKDGANQPKLLVDYLSENADLSEFINEYPDLKNFKNVIENRYFSPENRKVLVEVLDEQYKEINEKVNSKILLEQNTFTVTTGHQLNIFMGPLYVAYKIVTTINLARLLKKTYPNCNFVPVYWLASEDHDFEEINNFYYKNQTYKWDIKSEGPVGRLNPNALAYLMDLWAIDNPLFKKAYASFDTLSKSVRYYMHQIFGDEGLISIDSDNRKLKSLFRPVMKDDIFEHHAFTLVKEQTLKLENLGYKPQISAREINFFYIEDNLRERIEIEGDNFRIGQTDKIFSKAEMSEIIEKEPEKLSPNVVLRPLYQEQILPNLAYIGGPSEVPYWMQLKSVFNFYKTPFPILIPRNFALVINTDQVKTMENLGLSYSDLFKDKENLKKDFIVNHPESHISLSESENEIKNVFEKIKKSTSKLNDTLPNTTEAFSVKTQKLLNSLQTKIIRAEKRKYAEELNKIDKLIEKLFPKGSLQERKNTSLEFLSKDPKFINYLIEEFDPLDFQMYIFQQES